MITLPFTGKSESNLGNEVPGRWFSSLSSPYIQDVFGKEDRPYFLDKIEFMTGFHKKITVDALIIGSDPVLGLLLSLKLTEAGLRFIYLHPCDQSMAEFYSYFCNNPVSREVLTTSIGVDISGYDARGYSYLSAILREGKARLSAFENHGLIPSELSRLTVVSPKNDEHRSASLYEVSAVHQNKKEMRCESTLPGFVSIYRKLNLKASKWSRCFIETKQVFITTQAPFEPGVETQVDGYNIKFKPVSKHVAYLGSARAISHKRTESIKLITEDVIRLHSIDFNAEGFFDILRQSDL